MARSSTGNHAFTGVFLVGLGIVAWCDFWWPGILFVIAAAQLAEALVEGRLGEHLLTIAILVAIGGVGLAGKLHFDMHIPFWPVLFIVIGLVYLVKTFWKRGK